MQVQAVGCGTAARLRLPDRVSVSAEPDADFRLAGRHLIAQLKHVITICAIKTIISNIVIVKWMIIQLIMDVIIKSGLRNVLYGLGRFS